VTFAPRCLLAFCFAMLLTGLLPRHCDAQSASSQAVQTQPVAAQPASAQPAPASNAAPSANPQQAYTLPPEKLTKAIALSRIRNILDITGSLWALVFLWLLLATRAWAKLESCVQRISRHRWVQGLAFFAAFFIITTLASIPFDIAGHHFSRAYGISIQGWGSWLGDQSKALGLSVLIGTPILLLFNWIVRRWPRRYWLGIWVATLPIMVLLLFVSPLLEPIFNKFEPLNANHPALVAELEKVVARTGTSIPPERMYLMKASLKTNGLNAYVSGIGATKRVVVWDTTAGRIPDDEVLFIFGHESGHYVLHHIPKMLAGMAAALFFVFWACAGFAAWLARRFSARWLLKNEQAATAPLSTRVGFVVLLFAISVVSFLLTPASNAFSRYFEHEADVYGQEAIHGIVADPQKTAVAGFNALGEAWLEDPNPSPFIEFWEYNHPSVQTRANFALHYDPWANGGHGRFFDK